MTLGCRAFFNVFLSEFEKEKEKTNWQYIYDKEQKIWTKKMLGTGASRKKGDYGLLGRIGQKFGYKIHPEWRQIDQVWFIDLPKPEKWLDTPWRSEVLIEHENNINRLEFNIFKFGEVSAPLKVGIFYPGEDEKLSLELCREMILKQVSSYPGTAYLIIFGFLDEDKGIYWHGYEIDIKGNIIELNE